jgi:O-antigen ligase
VPFSFFWLLGQPVSNLVLAVYVTPGLYFTDLAVGLVLLISVCSFRSQVLVSPATLFGKVKFISLPLLALVILAGVSILFARSPALAAYTALRWLLAVVLFFSLNRLNFTTRQFVSLLVIGLSVQAVVGIAQVINKGPLHLPGELALAITQPRAAVIIIKNVSLLRAYGFTFHPNVLGGYLCAGMLLSLPLLTSKWVRPLWGLMGLGLLLTFSRSAWLAAALTFPLSILWLIKRFPELRRPILWALLPATIGILIAGGIFFDEIIARLNPFQSYSEFTSIIGRGQLIAISLDIIRMRPITGIGAGNFPLIMLDYKTLDPAHYVHNIPLLLASEVGLLGGFLWYWLWLAPAVKIISFWKSCQPWLFILVMTWFAWCVISLWDFYPWEIESGRLFSVILLALIAREFIFAKSLTRIGSNGTNVG